jgi:hypothetical protein
VSLSDRGICCSCRWRPAGRCRLRRRLPAAAGLRPAALRAPPRVRGPERRCFARLLGYGGRSGGASRASSGTGAGAAVLRAPPRVRGPERRRFARLLRRRGSKRDISVLGLGAGPGSAATRRTIALKFESDRVRGPGRRRLARLLRRRGPKRDRSACGACASPVGAARVGAITLKFESDRVQRPGQEERTGFRALHRDQTRCGARNAVQHFRPVRVRVRVRGRRRWRFARRFGAGMRRGPCRVARASGRSGAAPQATTAGWWPRSGRGACPGACCGARRARP